MNDFVYVVGLHKQELKIAKGDIRKSGEPVPEASDWPSNVLNSHLSLKWLMLKDEYEHVKKAEDARMVKKKQERADRELAKKEAEAERKAKVEVERKTKEQKAVNPRPSDPEVSQSLAPEDESSDNLDQMSRSELQEKCTELKVSTVGNSATLKKRLRGATS